MQTCPAEGLAVQTCLAEGPAEQTCLAEGPAEQTCPAEGDADWKYPAVGPMPGAALAAKPGSALLPGPGTDTWPGEGICPVGAPCPAEGFVERPLRDGGAGGTAYHVGFWVWRQNQDRKDRHGCLSGCKQICGLLGAETHEHHWLTHAPHGEKCLSEIGLFGCHSHGQTHDECQNQGPRGPHPLHPPDLDGGGEAPAQHVACMQHAVQDLSMRDPLAACQLSETPGGRH